MLSPVKVSTRDRQLLLERFLSRRSPSTRETYLQGLTLFSRWLGAGTPAEGIAWLLDAGVLEASARVSAWLDALAAAGKSEATIGARLSALRSAVQLGRMLGMVDWELEVPPPRIQALRDTRGPGAEKVHALVRAAMAQPCREKAARDAAILRLLYDLGLRRGEVVSIQTKDLDLALKVVRITGKGRRDSVPLSLPEGTAAALRTWLSWRGEVQGPLFYRLDNAGANLDQVQPLTGRAVADMVHGLALGLGFDARPHGLRHSAITAALDAGFAIRDVQRFARHRSVSHTIRYDDNRADLGGAVAACLSLGVDRVH